MKFKAFFKKRWVRVVANHLLFIGGGALLIFLISRIFGSFCPIKAIFKFSCPFCGMTRAHLAALRLDFAAAFSHHPLFFLGLPYLFLLFHEQLFKGKAKKVHLVLEVGLTILFLVVFFCRLF